MVAPEFTGVTEDFASPESEFFYHEKQMHFCSSKTIEKRMRTTKPITFIVSDESINRYGYRVLTDGIDTTQFERNPVGYYMHKRNVYDPEGDEVICKWYNLRKEGGKLLADAVFDKDDKKSMRIYGKVKKKFVRMASIGAKAIESSTDKKYLLQGQQYATVTKSELLEISIVDRGGNDNALMLYGDNGKEAQLPEKIKNVNMELLDQLRITLRQPEATQADVVTAVNNSQANAEKYKKLYDDMVKEKEEAQKKEATTLISKAVELGVLNDTTKPVYEALFLSDHNNAKVAINTLISATEKSDKGTGGTTRQLSDFLGDLDNKPKNEQNDIKLSFDYLSKKNPKKLQQIKLNEPETFKKLVKDYANGVRYTE